MTIFAILLPNPQAGLVDAIKAKFPDDYLEITPTQWLVSGAGTALDVVAKLGIYDPADPSLPAVGSAVVLASSSYHGRAPTPVWDWIKSKLEKAG